MIRPGHDDLLLIIDVQNDFCPGGALAVADGDAVVSVINRFAEHFDHVVLTQDWHPSGHSSFVTSHPGANLFESVAMPYGQVLTGLATKLVDGAENNWPSYVTTGHFKYAGYYTLTEHTMNPEVLVISKKAWSSLSAEDQQIFRESALRSSRYMREKWRDLEERSRQQAEEAGVRVVTDFDRKRFEAAMDVIYAKAQRDPAIARLIERIRGVD